MCKEGYGLNSWDGRCTLCTEPNCKNWITTRTTIPPPLNSTDPPTYTYSQDWNSWIAKYVFNSTDKSWKSCNPSVLDWNKGECLQWDLNLQWNICENGYFTSLTDTNCYKSCPSGTFPSITLDSSGFISRKEWAACPKECPKCNGADPTLNCLECPEGKYLSISDPTTFAGECLGITNNILNLDIFVSNDLAYISSGIIPDGTIDKPFYDLQDALNYGYEQASPNKNSVISIHLWKGTHYLVYQPSWHYHDLQYQNEYGVDYEISISPLYCTYIDPGGKDISSICVNFGTKVTVVNKRGSRFRIDGGKMLTITDIVFDSLDSLLPNDNSTALSWLNSRQICCKIGSSGEITNDTISDGGLCTRDIISSEKWTLTSYE